jgi:hypothetical protein
VSAPDLPLLAADLTYMRRNKGRVFSATSDWEEEDHEPTVGEHVMVADGSTGPLEAVIEEVRDDGTIVLSMLEFAGEQTSRPRKSVWGLWKGVSMSEQDIAEVRRDMRYSSKAMAPKIAQSKAELLSVLRDHKEAVVAAAERHGARNLRVFGPDRAGDHETVAVLADVDSGVNYFGLEDASTEIEEVTGYGVIFYTSDVVDQTAPGDPIRDAEPL